MRQTVLLSVLLGLSIITAPSRGAGEFVEKGLLSESQAAQLLDQVFATVSEARRNPEPRLIFEPPGASRDAQVVRVLFEPYTIEDGARLSVLVDCSRQALDEVWFCAYKGDRRDVTISGQKTAVRLLRDIDLATALLVLTNGRRIIDETPELQKVSRRFPSFPVFTAIGGSARGGLYVLWATERSGNVVAMIFLSETSPGSGALDVSLESFQLLKGTPR